MFRLLVRAVSDYGAHITDEKLMKKSSLGMVIINVLDSGVLTL
jgi:hypothetical protein